ncbi:MAG: HDIG domain-containing protein [Clostridioides sp.]|nr:HDIG domain-containing protein [Clostridioides sp.]
MIPKRVRQFYINLIDRMTEIDSEYARNLLSEEEAGLFFKLQKSEQKHSVRIAREIEEIFNSENFYEGLLEDTSFDKLISNNSKERVVEILGKNREKLIKIALLHDLGKTEKKLNLIDKSIIVILNKLTSGKLGEFKGLKKLDCYYKHGEYSYNLLKDMVFDEELLNVIRNHHKDVDNDVLTEFFQIMDDKN